MDKEEPDCKETLGSFRKCGKSHIWIAICTYLIVAYVKYQLQSSLSIYEIIQILGISAFDKTPLRELLTEDQFNQNVKEQGELFEF